VSNCIAYRIAKMQNIWIASDNVRNAVPKPNRWDINVRIQVRMFLD